MAYFSPMQVGRARGRTSGSGAPAAGPSPSATPAPTGWQLSWRTRQDYLDALPIAAAVMVYRDDESQLLASNKQYDMLDALSREGGAGPLLAREQLSAALRDFRDGSEPTTRFEWRDGHAVGGRHFIVCLARLAANDSYAERYLLSLVDRTVEVETERSLRAEVLHDSLTGLPNRVAFSEALEAALTSLGNASGFAVLVVNLTRFSRINECMGAMAGDELIITVARRLLSSLRRKDVLARIGGDEFGILLALREGPSDALKAAQRIQNALSTPFRLSELEIGITCAIGCAATGEGISNADEVLRNAQFALKRAKLTGRVEMYQPGEANAVRRRFSVETELRRAIEANQLELAYQPVVDLATGAISGFEALARWTHGEYGAVPPTEFIAVAEECGLIVPLGRWALDTAVRTLAAWDRKVGEPLPLRMAVNLSAIQLARDDVAAAVASALSAHQISGERLTLELTESAIIQDPERATGTLHALKALDASIAMDDFGTGYSSLDYLQRLPIDILKIDRSFVTGMLADRDKVAIVRAVLSLADALGMSTTAEGVETVELAQTLGALGCSYGQGYYYAEPMPADDALAYWCARNA